jgi:hypothetical protein
MSNTKNSVANSSISRRSHLFTSLIIPHLDYGPCCRKSCLVSQLNPTASSSSRSTRTSIATYYRSDASVCHSLVPDFSGTNRAGSFGGTSRRRSSPGDRQSKQNHPVAATRGAPPSTSHIDAPLLGKKPDTGVWRTTRTPINISGNEMTTTTAANPTPIASRSPHHLNQVRYVRSCFISP